MGFDAKRAFCNKTGLGNYSRMVIRSFALLNPSTPIVLFTPTTKGSFRSFFSDLPNVSVEVPHGAWRFLPSLWRSVGQRRAVSRSNVSVYHGLSHELPLFLPKDVKLVVTMHDLIVWRFPHLFPFFDRQVYKVKQRNACRRADSVVAISRQTRDDCLAYLHVPASRLSVIYQSCDDIFWYPVPVPTVQQVCQKYSLPKRYILCVGTIERRKNQLAVVEAMPSVDADVHLVIVGRATPYCDELKAAIARHGLEARVHFLHDALFADFPALYSGAVMSVYMSRFEGFGIPVLESMCCGTPVLTSTSSSLPEVGGTAALYADPDATADIVDKINSVCRDDDYRLQLANRCRIQASQFSAERIAQDFTALYNSLLC